MLGSKSIRSVVLRKGCISAVNVPRSSIIRPYCDGDIGGLPMNKRRQVAVVGAGVIGLSSAVRIQEALPHVEVTIIADAFNEGTLSDGAAGIFRPNWELLKGLPEDTVRCWVRDAWKKYDSLAHSEDASEAGVSIISGYQFSNTPVKEPLAIEDVVYHVRKCTPRDFATFPSANQYKYGYAFTTLMVESKWMLPYLMKQFKEKGGKVEVRKVHDLGELTGKYDVIVNAVGLAGRDLVNDKKIRVIRGQMERVKAPWVKHFVFSGDHDSWIVPGKETVVIGGTRQYDNESLIVDLKDKEGMVDRACAIMPSLRKADFQWTWVGLRPHREPIRLEKETMNFGGKKLKVVHNYGHGGLGITLSWGCACNAALLVESYLQDAHL